MIEIERVALLEIERELSSLWSEPEAVLAAEHVHMWLSLARGNGRAPDPAEARGVSAAGRARHHASLIIGRDHDLRRVRRLRENDHLRVLLEERKVRIESGALCL